MKKVRRFTRALSIALAAGSIALALSLASATSPAHPGSAYLPTAHSGLASLSLTTHPPFLGLQNSGIAEAAPVATNSSSSVYFRQTAHYVKDAFLNYWLMNGGLTTYGYPISEEFVSNGVSMQYFQRSRFEYRPGSSRPWKVELSPVGSLAIQGRTFAPATPDAANADRLYFDQTQHTLGGTFRQFWQANDGLAIFGYPLSEEMQENGRTVQYFERARFELAGQGRVQLGQLGTELLQRLVASGNAGNIAVPANRPGFNMSFRGEATWFRADWTRVIRLNKGWGNLPQDYVGQGLYAAAPADLNLYGRWARVTRGNRSVFVQFVDVINWPDIPYVRSQGIVIDLGQEAYQALGQDNGGPYEVSFDVFWPGEGPGR
ncbi:MAG: hypothetical protein IVW55_09525 [Chloroflexi bacterium]|nr:hypothetical protein [Chloroflexota bacterium]